MNVLVLQDKLLIIDAGWCDVSNEVHYGINHSTTVTYEQHRRRSQYVTAKGAKF